MQKMSTPRIVEHRLYEYLVTNDPSRLDLEAMHRQLRTLYWCEEIPFVTLQTAVANSLCFGMYHGAKQIGLVRLVTDFATLGYLCDVYVLDEYQGRKLGTWMIDCVMKYPMMAKLRRISLVTRDAQELYRKVGFDSSEYPDRAMEIVRPGMYKKDQPIRARTNRAN